MRATDGTHPSPPTAASHLQAAQRAQDVSGRRVERQARPPSCKVQPFDEERWPAGTLWLNTSITGPFNSHPLEVKRDDGSWDHVAWLAPVDTTT